MPSLTSVVQGGKSGDKNPDLQLLSLAAPIRHALRGLSYLAARPEENLRAAQVARALSLSATALSKSFQRLANEGLLESRRGPGGGYRLAAPAEQTTLLRVAQALEVEGRRIGHCALEDHPCRNEAPCALHNAAQQADGLLRRELSRLTLADLAAADAARRKSK